MKKGLLMQSGDDKIVVDVENGQVVLTIRPDGDTQTAVSTALDRAAAADLHDLLGMAITDLAEVA